MKKESVTYLLSRESRRPNGAGTPDAAPARLALRTLRAAARLEIAPRSAAPRVCSRKGAFRNV